MRPNRRPSIRPSFWPDFKRRPLYAILLTAFLLSLILLTVAKGVLVLREVISFGDPVTQQITVEGEGKVTIAPDTARLNLGVLTRGVSVAVAQGENTTITNKLLDKIKEVGVDAEDIRTSDYSVYEDRVWNRETNQYDSKGWIVSQNLTLTIRNLENVSRIIAIAGESNITNISGINFSTDNITELKQEVRDEAIASARKQAESIATALGVRVRGVVEYIEWTNGGSGIYRDYVAAEGVGGATPNIEPGTDDLRLSVSITYQLSN